MGWCFFEVDRISLGEIKVYRWINRMNIVQEFAAVLWSVVFTAKNTREDGKWFIWDKLRQEQSEQMTGIGFFGVW